MIFTKDGENKNVECWYRYFDIQSTQTGARKAYGSTVGVYLIREEYEVLKHTPTGVVINIGTGTRFVKNGTRKQFAHASNKEAIESFVYRKRAQRRIVRNQLDRAESAYIAGQELLAKLV